MSLILIHFHIGNLLNHMQILTKKTWPQPQGVENLGNVFPSIKKCVISYKCPAFVEELTYSDGS